MECHEDGKPNHINHFNSDEFKEKIYYSLQDFNSNKRVVINMSLTEEAIKASFDFETGISFSNHYFD